MLILAIIFNAVFCALVLVTSIMSIYLATKKVVRGKPVGNDIFKTSLFWVKSGYTVTSIVYFTALVVSLSSETITEVQLFAGMSLLAVLFCENVLLILNVDKTPITPVKEWRIWKSRKYS